VKRSSGSLVTLPVTLIVLAMIAPLEFELHNAVWLLLL
jgi:hypothetical protein